MTNRKTATQEPHAAPTPEGFFDNFFPTLEVKPSTASVDFLALADGASYLEPEDFLHDHIGDVVTYDGCSGERTICRCFGQGCGIAALKAYPLQCEDIRPLCGEDEAWRQTMGFDHFPQDFKLTQKRLRSCYGKMGFGKVSRDPYLMVKALF